MTAETTHYTLWVNWDACQVSMTEAVGFDQLTFCSAENRQSNLELLLSSGFRLQE